jgi:hypothetical protein
MLRLREFSQNHHLPRVKMVAKYIRRGISVFLNSNSINQLYLKRSVYMLISHRRNFVYTKTVKTAGTSVEAYFERYCMTEQEEKEWILSHKRETYESEAGIIGCRGIKTNSKWFNHKSALGIKNEIGPTLWEKYFKFCVIRNPFEKVLSMYYFKNPPKGGYLNKRNRKVVFPAFAKIENNKVEINQFREWVVKQEFGVLIDRDKYMINDSICMDYFIRYEKLHEGIQQVCDVIDVPYIPENLPNLKAGIRPVDRKLDSYYDRESKDIILKLFEFEFDYFGYSRNP